MGYAFLYVAWFGVAAISSGIKSHYLDIIHFSTVIYCICLNINQHACDGLASVSLWVEGGWCEGRA